MNSMRVGREILETRYSTAGSGREPPHSTNCGQERKPSSVFLLFLSTTSSSFISLSGVPRLAQHCTTPLRRRRCTSPAASGGERPVAVLLFRPVGIRGIEPLSSLSGFHTATTASLQGQMPPRTLWEYGRSRRGEAGIGRLVNFPLLPVVVAASGTPMNSDEDKGQHRDEDSFDERVPQQVAGESSRGKVKTAVSVGSCLRRVSFVNTVRSARCRPGMRGGTNKDKGGKQSTADNPTTTKERGR